jgi:hypothetical protein
MRLNKKTKTVIVGVMILLVAVGVVIIVRLGKTPTLPSLNGNQDNGANNDTSSDTQTQQQTIVPRNAQQNSLQYIVSQVKTNTGVIAHTWNQGKLVYATSKGIYEGETNKTLMNKTISEINANTQGQFVFQSGNIWSKYDALTEKAINVTISGTQPKINKKGDKIVSVNKSELSLLNVSDNKSTKEDTGFGIKTVVWAYDKNWIAVFGGTTVKLYDENLKLQTTTSLESDSTFLDISPDASVMAYAHEGSLILKPVDINQTSVLFEFGEDSKLSGNWITPTKFMVIETSKPDNLGRVTNYISRVDLFGTREFLTNTFAIPEKVDTSVFITTDPAQNIATLTENNGAIWFLGLVPGQYPYYTDQGVFLQTLPNQYLQGD